VLDAPRARSHEEGRKIGETMDAFYFIVRVDTDTEEHAEQVMAERLGCDENYGFDYTVNYTPQEEPS
jgi:hypothetical protein